MKVDKKQMLIDSLHFGAHSGPPQKVYVAIGLHNLIIILSFCFVGFGLCVLSSRNLGANVLVLWGLV